MQIKLSELRQIIREEMDKVVYSTAKDTTVDQTPDREDLPDSLAEADPDPDAFQVTEATD